ncbi:hypothetical protein T492DRAFT_894892 [Pavlovales sp. CCMP2436]|nr:hypothetical protein T492DRAFT_894892 [Pavlovales sp. CCMP2436]
MAAGGSGSWERKEQLTPADIAEAEESDTQIIEAVAEVEAKANAKADLLGAGRRTRGPWSRMGAVVAVIIAIPALMAAEQQRKSSRRLTPGSAETV